MTVQVQLFAVLRDRAGVGKLELPLPEGSTVGQAVDQLEERFPGIRDATSKILFAVNRDYASRETRLCDGDDLALIPPVSGG